ncbi:hypothetical protein PINS_up001243 [Pythium insidiosum]|nr:hypothetical protein PINS_up001243 [Pythium insidiosum]
MQLAMEYLLFLRARDGTVLDTLREELAHWETDCEIYAERARKWKERTRIERRQVEKLHQVLRNVAKLLQIEGATPEAMSTIETLLKDMTPRHISANQSHDMVSEARVCGFCGKMFSSRDYLDKHIVRRHPNEVGDLKPATRTMSNKNAGELLPVKHTGDMEDNNNFRELLSDVEKTLREQQASLRSVAQEEAEKIQRLYEQFHVELKLSDELRQKRHDAEQSLHVAREEMDRLHEEREKLMNEIESLKDHLHVLSARKKIEAAKYSNYMNQDQNVAIELELRRLQDTIEAMTTALSDSRSELERVQALYASTLNEKRQLEDQLHEARNQIYRLELGRPDSQAHIPVAKVNSSSQTQAIQHESVSVQTDHASSTANGVESAKITSSALLEAESQTALFVGADAMVQTDTVETADTPPTLSPMPPTIQIDDVSPPPANSPPEQDSRDQAVFIPSVFQLESEALIRQIEERATQHAVSQASNTASKGMFTPLERRKNVRSYFPHSEREVKQRIQNCLVRLDEVARRYGVSPTDTVLSNEHMQMVQRSLHAHLEILPSHVLKRMISVEAQANDLIKNDWFPQELSRQSALERLQVDVAVLTENNQRLVSAAMASLARVNVVDAVELPHADREVQELRIPITQQTSAPLAEAVQGAHSSANQEPTDTDASNPVPHDCSIGVPAVSTTAEEKHSVPDQALMEQKQLITPVATTFSEPTTENHVRQAEAMDDTRQNSDAVEPHIVGEAIFHHQTSSSQPTPTSHDHVRESSPELSVPSSRVAEAHTVESIESTVSAGIGSFQAAEASIRSGADFLPARYQNAPIPIGLDDTFGASDTSSAMSYRALESVEWMRSSTDEKNDETEARPSTDVAPIPRWSSSVGTSNVTSSELSFNASIPSLSSSASMREDDAPRVETSAGATSWHLSHSNHEGTDQSDPEPDKDRRHIDAAPTHEETQNENTANESDASAERQVNSSTPNDEAVGRGDIEEFDDSDIEELVLS